MSREHVIKILNSILNKNDTYGDIIGLRYGGPFTDNNKSHLVNGIYCYLRHKGCLKKECFRLMYDDKNDLYEFIRQMSDYEFNVFISYIVNPEAKL